MASVFGSELSLLNGYFNVEWMDVTDIQTESYVSLSESVGQTGSE